MNNKIEIVGPGGGGWYRGISVSRQNPLKIYLTGDRCGCYVSEDGGESWSDSTIGVINNANESVCVNPSNDNEALLASFGGVHKTTDGGKTWKNVFEGSIVTKFKREEINTLGHVAQVVYHSANSNICYAGGGGTHPYAEHIGWTLPCRIFKSIDGGNTWFVVKEFPPLEASTNSPTPIYPTGNSILAIETDPNNENVVYACTRRDGTWKTINGGNTWTKITTFPGEDMWSIAVNPKNSNILMGLEYESGNTNGPNVYRSDNGGLTWVKKVNGINTSYCVAEEIHFDKVTGHVYIGIRATQHNDHMYKSIDLGENWINIGRKDAPVEDRGEDGSNTTTFDVYNGVIVTAAGFVSVSYQDGAYGSWKAVLSKVPSPGKYYGRGTELANGFMVAVDPSNSNNIYWAVADRIFYKSEDGGKTWIVKTPNPRPKTTTGLTITFGTVVAYNPVNPNIMFAGCRYPLGIDGGILRSMDGGNTWQFLDYKTGFPIDTHAEDIVFNSQGHVFVSFRYSGTYKSIDNGNSWIKIEGSRGSGGHLTLDKDDETILYVSYKYPFVSTTTTSTKVRHIDYRGIWIGKTDGTGWPSTYREETINGVLHTYEGQNGYLKDTFDHCSKIIIDKNNHSRFWITQFGTKGGIYLSTNKLQTVSLKFKPLKDDANYDIINADFVGLAIDPINSNKIFAVTNDGSIQNNVWRGQGIWKTEDGGNNWEVLTNTGHNTSFGGINIHPQQRALYVNIDARSMLKIYLDEYETTTRKFYISANGTSSWNNSSQSTPTNISQLLANQTTLLPGDEIYFKRGDTFNQIRQLDLTCNGTADKKIKFSVYGDTNLNKPIITFKTELNNWKDSTKWSLVNEAGAGPNIWWIELKSDHAIDRCWNGDSELKAAYYYKLQSYIPEGRVLKFGDNGDGTTGVCAEHQFCYDNDNNKFYIYSPNGNPANNFTKIIIPGTIYNNVADRYGIKIKGNYLIFENIDVRGAFYSSVGLQSCEYVLFNSCNIGHDSNWSGISNIPGYVSKNIEVAYCNIDSHWDFNYIFYTQRTPYGVNLTNGSSYWDVHHCLIKDWWMNIFVIANGMNTTVKNSQYHKIHHNEITSRCTFGKAIQISAGGIFESDPNTYVHFYNNNVHDIVFGMQISAYSNYAYFNIFKNLLLNSTNEHGTGDGGFIAHMISDTQQLGSPFYNYFINNTIVNTRYYVNTYQGKEVYWINNLIVDAGLDIPYITKVSQYGNGEYKNNIFYKRNTTTSSKFIKIDNIGEYSVTEFNALNGQYDKVIINNKQYIGNVGDLINNDCELIKNSMAISAGDTIQRFSFLPTTLTDIFGNTVNKTSLNVGAYAGNGIDVPQTNSKINKDKLYNYILGLNNKSTNKVLSGEFVWWKEKNTWEELNTVTGHYPAIQGIQITHWTTQNDINIQIEKMQYALNHFNSGGIIEINWGIPSPVDFSYPAPSGNIVDLTQLVTGGSLNSNWNTLLDLMASCLQIAKDAGAPVLFRPFNEMQGNWFWWGAYNRNHTDGVAFKNLWIYTHNYLTNVKGLDNIIWVYAPSIDYPSEVLNYYPGSEYVDIVGIDCYICQGSGFTTPIKFGGYDALQTTGKPFAICEVGLNGANGDNCGTTWSAKDSLVVINSIKNFMPKTVYFYSWGGYSFTFARQLNTKQLYEDSWVITREELDIYNNTQEIPIIINQPVDVIINYGSDATFTVTSNNTNSYQWQEYINNQWVNISGETTNILFFNKPNVTTNFPPQILTEPLDLTVNNNSSATFVVKVKGTEPLTYNWYVNNIIINNNLDTLILNNVNISMNNNIYKCIVTNEFGTVTTRDAKLTVLNIIDDNRVTQNLRILYRFNEGSGNIINNVSNVDTDYDLVIKTNIKGE